MILINYYPDPPVPFPISDDDSEVKLLGIHNSDGEEYTEGPFLRSFASDTPTPKPTTILLFGDGLVGLAGFGRKKFKK